MLSGCGVECVQDGKLFLYTAKTSQEFTTSRNGCDGARCESLAKIFRKSESERRPRAPLPRHIRCRELLKSGTPIGNVAAFLEHASDRVTQKHYSPWVKARQARAEANAMASWESDPVLAMASRRVTLQVTRKARDCGPTENSDDRMAGTTGLEPAASAVTVHCYLVTD
jgi:hypothetical protein